MSAKVRIYVMWGALTSENTDNSGGVDQVLEHIERICRRDGLSLGLGQWCEDLQGQGIVPLEDCDSLLVGIANGEMDVELWCSADSAKVCFYALREVEDAINNRWGQAQIWINDHDDDRRVMMRLENVDSMSAMAFALLSGRGLGWERMC